MNGHQRFADRFTVSVGVARLFGQRMRRVGLMPGGPCGKHHSRSTRLTAACAIGAAASGFFRGGVGVRVGIALHQLAAVVHDQLAFGGQQILQAIYGSNVSFASSSAMIEAFLDELANISRDRACQIIPVKSMSPRSSCEND